MTSPAVDFNAQASSKLRGDSGFNCIEISDTVGLSKRQFNVNTVSSRPLKHEDNTARFKRRTNRANGYNLLTGAAHDIVPTKKTFAKQTLLQPRQEHLYSSSLKQEYKEGIAASPRIFHRQNGDFTAFQGLKVANNLISCKNFSPKMRSSLFN